MAIYLLCIKKSVKNILVLVSKGDKDTFFCDQAQELTQKLLSSNLYENVFCNLWLASCDENNFEKLDIWIKKSSTFVLVCSPHGKKSYEDLLQKKSRSTWRDEFNVGSYSILRKYNIFNQKKIYVVYASDENYKKSDEIHSDFEKVYFKSFNIFNKSEKKSLYKKLLSN